ncbi:uncharacterized protein BDR25DRAFT_279183 [Lindgomyces ingoldianus]|uniref:Uncharacterized protein n=1 Tax=Lindgomyces ingoldianus TaxID=673940 RepID=A0ACB6R7Y6_9PLEO|nr:uncharacterized protein BDR25DRAFT_279183 [Lindgomyces ingoldianus]KAF2475202.1 hypothetical protein BDR25DRAFT_279183 [Lindgomyces ingoldianus]
MISKTVTPALLPLLLAALTTALTTSTATLLIPDWCVTQSQPTVTVLGSSSDLTTYSYSCSTDTSKVLAASSKASAIEASAKSKASALQASLGGVKTKDHSDNARRYLAALAAEREKRDSSYECYGYDAFDACLPWEVTQGASYWAVHYTVTGIVAVDEVCTFGDGGVASGDATCTGSGRLDPSIWGDGDGSHTETFKKTDVDEFFIRNTVPVTMGGKAVVTGTGAAASGTFAANANATGTAAGAQSTGVAAGMAIPTGIVAMAGAAGGILAAALAL